MSIPSQQNALFLQESRGEWRVAPRSVPKPASGEVLVRIEAVGLNPVDWKIHDEDFVVVPYPAVLGFDGAGVVVQLGTGVTAVALGDKVFYQAQAGNNDTATFQQYAVTPADLVSKIPANLTFDQAAAVPVCVATAAVGLYAPKIPSAGADLIAPWKEHGRGKYANQPILVIGGSSAVGQAVIQFAKLSGFSPIITTVSPSNNALVTSLGATHTIDRSLPLSSLSSSLASITTEPIRYIFDPIAYSETQNAAYELLAPGGTLIVSLPSEIKNPVESKYVVESLWISTCANSSGVWSRIIRTLEELLASGDIKPNRVDYIPGGLASVPDGLDRLRKNKVSGQKLIARPTETV